MGDRAEEVRDDEFNRQIRRQAQRVMLKGTGVGIALTILAVLLPL